MSEIITVSHFECNRIRKALNIPTDRIMTIYNGYNEHFHPMETINMQVVNRYISLKDFLFFWEIQILKRIRQEY